MRSITERHLAWKPRSGEGLEGVRAFGNHLFRDILATGILKATDSPQQAADAIRDKIETIMKYYVFSDPNERRLQLRRNLDAALDADWVAPVDSKDVHGGALARR